MKSSGGEHDVQNFTGTQQFWQKVTGSPAPHGIAGDGRIADAILDRIIHNAHRVTLEGDSMSPQKSPTSLNENQNSEINQN